MIVLNVPKGGGVGLGMWTLMPSGVLSWKVKGGAILEFSMDSKGASWDC